MANTSAPGSTISALKFCALSFASGFHYPELHLCSPSSNLASKTEGLKVRNGDASEANVIEAREKKIISLHKCLRDTDAPGCLSSHLFSLQTLNCRAASLKSHHTTVSLSIQLLASRYQGSPMLRSSSKAAVRTFRIQEETSIPQSLKRS